MASTQDEIRQVLATLQPGSWEHTIYMYYANNPTDYDIVKLFSTGTGFSIQCSIFKGESVSKKNRDLFNQFMTILTTKLPVLTRDIIVYRGDRTRDKVQRRKGFPFYASFDILVAYGYAGNSDNIPIRRFVLRAGTRVCYHHYLKQVIISGGTVSVVGNSYVDTITQKKLIDVNVS